MATISKEELIDEIINNARRDRKRLEAVADGLANGFARVPTSGEDEIDDHFDSEVAAAFAEEISKISDSLSKVNQQLVEIVKSERKNSVPDDASPKKLTPDQIDGVYDEINPQEAN